MEPPESIEPIHCGGGEFCWSRLRDERRREARVPLARGAEPPERIELSTYSLRVNRSAD